MAEQVKYTADDYELAESIADCPSDAESLAQTFADIRQQGRAEAQQRLTDAQGEVKRLRARFGAVGTRLAAAEKLAQALKVIVDSDGRTGYAKSRKALAEWEAAGK